MSLPLNRANSARQRSTIGLTCSTVASVGLPTLHWNDGTLPKQLADDRPVAIGIDDANDLVHARGPAWVGGLEALSGKDLIDVAHDGVGLIDRFPVVLKGRHLAERLAGEVARLLSRTGQDVHWFEPILGGLLFEREPGGAGIGAVGRSVDDRYRHDRV